MRELQAMEGGGAIPCGKSLSVVRSAAGNQKHFYPNMRRTLAKMQTKSVRIANWDGNIADDDSCYLRRRAAFKTVHLKVVCRVIDPSRAALVCTFTAGGRVSSQKGRNGNTDSSTD